MAKYREDISEKAKGIIEGMETRAVLISDLITACEELGYDVETISDKCFYACGVAASKEIDGDNPDEFVRFMTDGNVEVFDKEVIKLDPKHSVARFHYCPLSAKWEEMGLPRERVRYLCDLAHKSDYGRASNFKNVVLTFPKRLSCGDAYCELDAKAKESE